MHGERLSHFQLKLFGTPVVTRDGKPVASFAQRKTLALLCYLAVTGGPHSRASLATLLWSESTEANARAGLRKVLAELRTAFGKHILITRQEVTLNPAAPLWLDVMELEAGMAVLSGRHGAGLTQLEANKLQNAVDLYQGEFLKGFHVHRAPDFEEWLLLQRERLRLATLRLLYVLATYHFAQGAYAEAIQCAERVLVLEPCHEEAHRLLMSVLALVGQQPAALRQYQTCCKLLSEELGLEPQEETTTLYERIRNKDTWEVDDHAARPLTSKPLIPLIGRKRELMEIAALLRDPHLRLLTIIGPGGSGKTRLALEIAASSTDNCAPECGDFDGIHFIPVGSLQSVDSLVPAIAHGIGFYFAVDKDPRRQLLTYLSHRRAVLILDSCETLLGLYEPGQGTFIDLIDHILDAAPHIKILVTSRSRLNLPCEHLYPLSGLDYPRMVEEDTAGLRSYDAIEFFLWCVGRIQPNLDPSGEDLKAMAQVCKSVAGMPLQILLLANWVRLLTPGEIAAQISGRTEETVFVAKNHLGNLEVEWADVQAHQRSLRAVFDHTWHFLSDQEREALESLTVFRGGFTYLAAKEISGLSMREILALLDQSLISRLCVPRSKIRCSGPEARFGLHDLLHQYVASKLKEGPHNDTITHERHCSYYFDALRDWTFALKCAREQQALKEMDFELGNIRAAWQWALEHRRYDQIDQVMEGLCRYYDLRYRHAEGWELCRLLLKALSEDLSIQEKLLAKTLVWQSQFSSSRDEAIQLLKKSLFHLDRMEAAGQDVIVDRAFALLQMGRQAAKDNHSESKQLLERSLELYQTIGADWETASVLKNLLIRSWEAGEFDKGKQFASQSLALYRKLDYRRGIGGVLGDCGIGTLQSGQVEDGLSMIKESVAIFREIGDRASMVRGLYYSSIGHMFLGKWGEANSQMEECVSICEDIGLLVDEMNIAQGIVQAHMGYYSQARLRAETGLAGARATENLMCMGRALTVLGWVALATGGTEAAYTFASQATDIYRNFGQKTEIGMALATLGLATRELGNTSHAQTCFYEALHIATKHQDLVSLIYALTGICLLQIDLERREQAVALFSLLARYPMVINSCWFDRVMGNPIADLQVTMPSDLVSRALEHGRTLDLRNTVQELLVELSYTP